MSASVFFHLQKYERHCCLERDINSDVMTWLLIRGSCFSTDWQDWDNTFIHFVSVLPVFTLFFTLHLLSSAPGWTPGSYAAGYPTVNCRCSYSLTKRIKASPQPQQQRQQSVVGVLTVCPPGRTVWSCEWAEEARQTHTGASPLAEERTQKSAVRWVGSSLPLQPTTHTHTLIHLDTHAQPRFLLTDTHIFEGFAEEFCAHRGPLNDKTPKLKWAEWMLHSCS